MTGYRCVNDLFAYCSDHPRIRPTLSEPNPGGPNISTGALCSKKLTKCGFFVTHSQKCLDNPLEPKKKRTRTANKATKQKK